METCISNIQGAFNFAYVYDVHRIVLGTLSMESYSARWVALRPILCDPKRIINNTLVNMSYFR